MTLSVAEAWVEAPLRRFIDDARVSRALLLHPSGRVLARHGFDRPAEVMSACALAAGIRASAGELGRMLDGQPFVELHHGGTDAQLYLAEVPTPRGEHVLLVGFGGESSLGLVRLYRAELAERLAALVLPAEPAAVRLPADFERDLNRNLAVLFGRA